MASDDPTLADGRLRYLKGRVEADPDGRWYLPLGAALLDFGFIDDAIAVLEAGLRRDPASIGGWVLLGKGLLSAGRLDEALKILETVVSRDRENAVALRGLADIHRRRGHRQRAADYYRALLRLIPWDLEAQQGMAQVLAAPGELAGDGPKQTSEVFERPALEEMRAPVLSPEADHLRQLEQHGAAAAVEAGAARPGNGGAPAHPLIAASAQAPKRDRAAGRSARRPARPAVAAEHGGRRRVPGIFEPPPRDLSESPKRRHRERQRGKKPPPAFGNFMRWVQQVSSEGRDGLDD